jgi:hypothetical protein
VRIAAAAISFLLIGIAGSAHAVDQILVGVTSVRFAWTAASGSPSGYFVSRSLNGGTFQQYTITSSPSVSIPVAPGDQIMIQVAAASYDSTGYHAGPMSTVSDRVIVQRAPVFPSATGSWLLRCPTCNTIQNRSVSDASQVLAQAEGLASPWRVLGTAKLQNGRDQIIWQNSSTGKLSVYDAQFLAPITGLTDVGPAALRGVGAADFDGDGKEEFVVQRTDTGTVMAWAVNSGRFENIGTIPGPPGGKLVAVRDFDHDGHVDLLWQDPIAGTLDLWRLANDPTVATPITTLIAQIVRVASNLTYDATVAATGDFDGDGYPDVLFRYANGRLAISYLVAGLPLRYVVLTAVTGDIDRRVVGSVEIGGTAGTEIALQDNVTGLITILDPSPTGSNTRTAVLHPGSEWRVVSVGS